MKRGAWRAAVCGVIESLTYLSSEAQAHLIGYEGLLS